MGYLSAWNQLGNPKNGNIISNTDAQGAFSWLDAYCKKNPLNDLDDAVQALVIELMRRQSR